MDAYACLWYASRRRPSDREHQLRLADPPGRDLNSNDFKADFTASDSMTTPQI
jgi:hypothetical protein